MIKKYNYHLIKQLRKKAPDYIRSSGKALVAMGGGKYAMDGNNFTIDGPCKTVYDYQYDEDGNPVFKFRILWLETLDPSDTISAYYDEDAICEPMKRRIVIDSDAIVKNGYTNKISDLPVCHVFEDDKLLYSCMSVEIAGPCRVIYDGSLEGMYKTWIDTNSEIKIIG